MTTYELRANNTAVASENKMHDDAVARTYGFAGGLVPGVDVYAYMTHVAAERWGLPWLERGTMSGRFLQPVYDGDPVTVAMGDDGSIELRDSRGELCASGSAALPDEPAPVPPPEAVPPANRRPSRRDRPPASPETLAVGTVLGTLEFGFHAEKAGDYLADVGETLPLYRDAGVAHPGWLLRTANLVLVEHVVLGPWIHVSSAVTHHGLVRDGAHLETRARVTDLFERKGHRFVALDVLIVADGAAVMRVDHTAIYQPRTTVPA